MDAEFWTKTHCPKCSKVNWVHTGNSWDDCATLDTSGFKCWSCGEETAWNDWDEELDEDENLYPEPGLKEPPR